MHRLDYYYKQTVTETELDNGFEYAERADRAMMADTGRTGIMSGLTVAQQGVPNMTVQLGSGTAYDALGERINLAAPTNVDCSVDYNGTSTAVVGAGNEKYLSIFIYFKRTLTDPRTDGNGVVVYFDRAEDITIHVVQGVEAGAGLGTRPALDANGLLVADVKLSFGSTSVVTAMILTDRRQDSLVSSGTPRALRRGLVSDALADLLGWYNAHVTAAADKHAATDINYAGSGAWADGTTNPATSVEAQLDKIVSDLAGAAGTAKIEGAALPAWADGTTSPAGTLFSQLSAIINALATGAGGTKIHTNANGAGLAAGTVRSQLDALDTRTYGFLRVVSAGIVTSGASFNSTSAGGVDIAGSEVTFNANAGDIILVFHQFSLSQSGGTFGEAQVNVKNPDNSGLYTSGYPGGAVMVDATDPRAFTTTIVGAVAAVQTGSHKSHVTIYAPGGGTVTLSPALNLVVVLRP